MTTETKQTPTHPSPDQVAVALAENARIEKLVRPTLDYNQRVAGENLEVIAFFEAMLLSSEKGGCTKAECRRASRGFLRHKKKLPFTLDEPHASVLKKEYATNRVLKRRTPDRWVELIRELPIHVRPAVASVIWWDFFAYRPSKKRWDELDGYLAKYWNVKEVSEDEIRSYLATLGYSPYRISVRLNDSIEE